MSNPVLTAQTNKATYAPGEAINGSWLATDADNAVYAVRVRGEDSQGLPATIDVQITVTDEFTAEAVEIINVADGSVVKTLAFNQAARTFSGTVPVAP